MADCLSWGSAGLIIPMGQGEPAWEGGEEAKERGGNIYIIFHLNLIFTADLPTTFET